MRAREPPPRRPRSAPHRQDFAPPQARHAGIGLHHRMHWKPRCVLGPPLMRNERDAPLRLPAGAPTRASPDRQFELHRLACHLDTGVNRDCGGSSSGKMQVPLTAHAGAHAARRAEPTPASRPAAARERCASPGNHEVLSVAATSATRPRPLYASRVTMCTSDCSVRCTGHLSAISSSRCRCASSSGPSSAMARSSRSIRPSRVSHSAQSRA